MAARIPTYRRHPSGCAFIQLNKQRYYLGKHGAASSRALYDRIVAELKENPDDLPPSLPMSGRGQPSYRKHKTSGLAFVEVRQRRYYLGRHGTKASKAKYHRVLAELQEAPDETPPTLDDGSRPALSVAELVERHWLHAQDYYPADTRATFRPMNRRLCDMYAELAVDQFGPAQLKAIRQQMIAAGNARNYINSTLNKIKALFRWGVSESLVPVRVVNELETLAGLKQNRSAAREPEPKRPVDPADVDAVLPHLSPVVRAMVQIQQLTGMRSDNLCAMRECDIDADGPIWIYRPPRHKSAHRGRGLQIPLGPKAQAIIGQFLTAGRAADDYLFKPAESKAWHFARRRNNRQTPMTPSQAKRGRKKRPQRRTAARFNARTYRRSILYAMRQARKAGELVNHWHPHRLRHSFGTSIRQAFGIEEAQVMLGHARADVTQLYAEKNLKLALEVARKIG